MKPTLPMIVLVPVETVVSFVAYVSVTKVPHSVSKTGPGNAVSQSAEARRQTTGKSTASHVPPARCTVHTLGFDGSIFKHGISVQELD